MMCEIDKKIKETQEKLADITKDIHENGQVVYDWNTPFLKSKRSDEAYKVLREFNNFLLGEMEHEKS